MSDVSAPAIIPGSQRRHLSAILWGGLFAGVFDITQAFIGFGLLGAKPFKILQHIAGGILRSRSDHVGWSYMSVPIGFSTKMGIGTARNLPVFVRRPRMQAAKTPVVSQFARQGQ